MKNIHLIATDKPSILAYYQESTSYKEPVLQLVSTTSSDYKYQNIYITSEEEIISLSEINSLPLSDDKDIQTNMSNI
jgi:hypothetical protein